jgi:hypothetical protein
MLERALSCPATKSARVGILRIEYRWLVTGEVSVFSLTKRTNGICLAALTNSGAIDLQGPYQAAQKSTKTGACVYSMNFENDASLRSTGSLAMLKNAGKAPSHLDVDQLQRKDR